APGSGGGGLIRFRARNSSLLIPNCPGATITFSVFLFCFHFASSSHKQHSFNSSSLATAQPDQAFDHVAPGHRKRKRLARPERREPNVNLFVKIIETDGGQQ